VVHFLANNNDKTSRLYAVMAKLLSPIAIGLYITGFCFFTALHYYGSRNQIETASQYIHIIDDIVRISTDFRMRFRGLRPGHPDVAILDIDDRSLDDVGRWPWPRDIVGRLFDNAFNGGAKIIASDMIWSELGHRPEIKLYNALKKEGALTQSQEAQLQKTLTQLDSDLIFSRSLENYKDKFVLGNVYLSQSKLNDNHIGQGYTSLCTDLAFEFTRAGQMWNKQNSNRLIAVDTTEASHIEFPYMFRELYTEIFKQMRLAVQENNTTLNSKEIETKYFNEAMKFCKNDFLTPGKDPLFEDLSANWAAITEQTKINAASLEEWARSFKSSYLSNQILEVEDWLLNIEPLSLAGKNNGYFNAILDPDSTIRRAQLMARTGNSYFPSISFAAYLMANNYVAQINIAPNLTYEGSKGTQNIEILTDEGESLFKIPVAYDGSLIIDYAGPKAMFPHISATDIQ
jgi:hypothetical protein